jgi:hypothetical protein
MPFAGSTSRSTSLPSSRRSQPGCYALATAFRSSLPWQRRCLALAWLLLWRCRGEIHIHVEARPLTRTVPASDRAHGLRTLAAFLSVFVLLGIALHQTAGTLLFWVRDDTQRTLLGCTIPPEAFAMLPGALALLLHTAAHDAVAPKVCTPSALDPNERRTTLDRGLRTNDCCRCPTRWQHVGKSALADGLPRAAHPIGGADLAAGNATDQHDLSQRTGSHKRMVCSVLRRRSATGWPVKSAHCGRAGRMRGSSPCSQPSVSVLWRFCPYPI